MFSLECPYPPRNNPHVREAEAGLKRWLDRHDLLRSSAARRRFDEARFCDFAGQTYPEADAAGLELVAQWFAWMFLIDDQLDDGSVGRNLDLTRSALHRMLAEINGDVMERPRHLYVDDSPIAASLFDLWHRTSMSASEIWKRRFSQHLEQCFAAAFWEAQNRVHGRIPSETEYIRQRRHTGAIYLCMDLIEVIHPAALSPAVYDSVEFSTTLDAACNVVCWTNDIYSCEKEANLGEYHNLVLLAEKRGMTRASAMAHAAARTNQERRAFDHHVARLRYRARGTATPMDADHQRAIEYHVRGMKSWIRGNLDWSANTSRYTTSSHGRSTREGPEYLESLMTAQ